jgi:hypothetical protein
VSVAAVVDELEASGAVFRLDGEKVRVWYPDEQRRQELAGQVALLRNHRTEVTAFLKTRTTIPAMPPGVRLIDWKLKEPPVAIDICSVVVEPEKFARTTLNELRIALANQTARRKQCVGWTVVQLIDRLAQVGVRVVLETACSKNPISAGAANG